MLKLKLKKRVNMIVSTFSFRVRFQEKDDFQMVDEYCERNLMTFKQNFNPRTKRYYREKDKDYFIALPEQKMFLFPIGFLHEFMNFLGRKQIKREEIFLLRDPGVKQEHIKPLNVKDISGMELRDYQQEYVNILSDPNRPNMLLMDMATGGGKGFCLAQTMLRWNMRTAILLIPQYIEKWIAEFQRYFNVTRDDIFVIQGSDSIRELFEMNRSEIKYKIIIISLRTMMNFITDTLAGEGEYYGGHPEDLLDHLSVGLLATDETHQHYYSVYISLLYLNTYRLIAMSATLETNKKDIQELYDLVFPKSKKLSGIYNPGQYVDVVAVDYNFQSPRRLKYQRARGYNQILLEQNILKRYNLSESYAEMVYWLTKKYYLDKRTSEDKLLVTCSSVDMATFLSKYLKSKLPDYDVRRYVQEDPYENLMDAQICVSTVTSSSVGHDIKNLLTLIQLSSIISSQLNIQSLGRLRKREGKQLYYVYIFTTGIPTQYKAHKERRALFDGRVKEYIIDRYPKILKMS